jgi:hypothetical protein
VQCFNHTHYSGRPPQGILAALGFVKKRAQHD